MWKERKPLGVCVCGDIENIAKINVNEPDLYVSIDMGLVHLCGFDVIISEVVLKMD